MSDYLDYEGLQRYDELIKKDISNKITGPSSSTDSHVVTFDGTTGKLVKDSGFTIGKSVPSNALFSHYLTNVSGTAGTKDTNRTIWTGTLDGVTALYTGLIIIIKVPLAGVNKGVELNVNNLGGHPVVMNVNTIITTHYAVGAILTLIYDADQTASLTVNGTVTSYTGCWKMVEYDSNSDIAIRLYKQITNNATWNQDYPLLASRTLASSIAETDSKYTAIYGLIGSNSVTPMVNPITGGVKVKSLTINGTLLESKTAATSGTDLSLVTTGEKYTWNNKLDSIEFNTQYNASSNKAATMADITDINSSLVANTLLKTSLSLTSEEKSLVKTNLGLPQELYSKTEVNELVSSPHQNYVTVATYADLANIANPSNNTIYRVSNYNGNLSQVDVTVYSEYAWTGTLFLFLCIKSQIGEVFDISVYHANTEYADLTAALGTNGVNVPADIRRNGMSIKYIDSSSHKYVQYMLKNQWSLDADDWILCNSVITESQYSSDLDIADENGNVIVCFKDGNIKTKNFDSRNVRKYADMPAGGYENFLVEVNNVIEDNYSTTQNLQDSRNIQLDRGIIMLPPNYSATGEPVRLVIASSSSGGKITSSTTFIDSIGPRRYDILGEGYAVMTINGTPGYTDGITSYGGMCTPGFLKSIKAAYEYVTKKYNLKKDGVFLSGYSQGTAEVWLIAANKIIPVKAMTLFGFCADIWKVMYAYADQEHREWMCEQFGFIEKEANSYVLDIFSNIYSQGDIVSKPSTYSARQTVPTDYEFAYILNNYETWLGYNPICWGTSKNIIGELFRYRSWGGTPNEDLCFQNVANIVPCPTKIFVGTADTVTPLRLTSWYKTMANNAGMMCNVRILQNGTHLYSNATVYNSINVQTKYYDSMVTTTAPSWEGMLFLERYD